MINNKTVVVGMSGGVDSSVACFLLKKMGYKVIGLHMKSENIETAQEDQQFAQSVCDKIGVELIVVDYSNQMQVVKDYFLDEYKNGRTPNPCVICNKEVKFKPFIEYAEKLDADYFATGHYAIIEHNNSDVILKKAIDTDKDQSYFLNQLSKKQLEKALFPLGSLTKTEVRKIAEQNNLINAHKKDSFDVCFVGSKKFKDYIDEVCPAKSGDIIDIKTNKKVGKHHGLMKYTLGQRRGLGIGGFLGGTGESWFVAKKDIESNILYVTQGNTDVLLTNQIKTGVANWLVEPENDKLNCKVKIRYRQEDQDAMVEIQNDNSLLITFKQPQRAVAVGQFAVLYNDDICLGGAVIEE